MAQTTVNGIKLYYEEKGEGSPILCIHGTGSSALMWGEAVDELARLGRVIAYDRRGCTRSERPETYERTTVSEHADDAAALLESLGAIPAVVIGRSYGGAVAIDLALRHPDLVRALVLLEPADVGLSPGVSEWAEAMADRIREAASRDGVDAAGKALIGEALGPRSWDLLPDGARRMFSENSPAILAEVEGGQLQVDAEALTAIDRPALIVAATDSPPEFREVCELVVDALPNARFALVDGGHLINPASPAVLEFMVEVLDLEPSATSG